MSAASYGAMPQLMQEYILAIIQDQLLQDHPPVAFALEVHLPCSGLQARHAAE